MKEVRALDSEILQELYIRYGKEVYRYLFSLCRDSGLAEDICQEAFLKAILSLGNENANARAWLYKVARNLMLNEMRKRRREQVEADMETAARGPGAQAHGKDQESDPAWLLIRGEREALLWQVLKTLDTRKREVLVLNYVERFSLKETARIMGLSGIWCAPRLSEDFTSCSMNLGFYLDPGQGFSMEWDREKYPDLVLWGDEQEINMDVKLAIVREEASAAEHFGVMLNYMADQEQFLEMMGQVPDRYREAAEYVEENGLTVYGFACRADKETLQNMHQMREVYSIYTQELD